MVFCFQRLFLFGVAPIAALVLFVPMGLAQGIQRQVPGGVGEVMWSFAPLVREASPAVVNIETNSLRTGRLNGFLSPFDDNRLRQSDALGSGVIVSVDGIVVTNAHVIAGADEIEVILTNNDRYFARVLYEDERTDIAFLKLEANGAQFPVLSIGNSDTLQIGDFVLAIGNPFGIGQSTSMGIVSALNRTDLDVIDTGSFIQTDAAINPGNSGGALINIKGELVGINSAILGRSSAGIGWAIPSNFVRSTLTALQASDGKLVRPWMSIAGRSLDRQTAAALGMRDVSGVLIESIFPGSPAESLGLAEGDVIVGVDGEEIENFDELKFAFANKFVGDQLALTVLTRGDTQEVVLDLIAPPETPARNATQLFGRHPLEGVTVVNVNPAVIEENGLNNVSKGVMIEEVPANSVAARLRSFRAGDVIISMQRTPIDLVDDILELTQQRTRRWEFELIREGRLISVRTTF